MCSLPGPRGCPGKKERRFKLTFFRRIPRAAVVLLSPAFSEALPALGGGCCAHPFVCMVARSRGRYMTGPLQYSTVEKQACRGSAKDVLQSGQEVQR